MNTLLIADDEQLERQALRFIIENNCPDVRIIAETGDGKNAVAISTEEKPDIVLMDIRMPELNGLEAARAIRAVLPDTTIVMLTAFDEFNYAKEALSLGAAEYLLKPLRPKDLLQTLKTVTEKIEQRKRKEREEAELKKNLDQAMPFIKNSFIYDVISGKVTDLDNFRDRAGFLGIKADSGVILVANIDNFKQLTSRTSELEKQMVKQKVYQHVCEIAGKEMLVVPFGGDEIIIYIGYAGEASPEQVAQEVRDIAGRIRDDITQLGISVTIGIGRYYTDPLQIHKSYLEAVSAEQQKFYIGDNQIIHIDDVPHLSMISFRYPFNYERNLLDKVRCGERQQAKEILRQLLHEIFTAKASIETVKACVLELLIVLSRAAVEGGANLEQLTLLNFKCINHLTSCADREEVRQWILDSLDQFMDNMLENRSSMNVRLINKACTYITKNFHKSISLEEVAQTVHLSPYYFSRIFKAEKGCNFVEFLTKVRIDKAKQMLKNPDQTVVRVAAEAGYQDASYFCRVFRQEVGITPNQYRTRLKNSKAADTTV
ncbi:response regulator [Sporomusa acidovorans]|uniref:Protein-glutamate methylesterase/protein-glutamine glutaminase n=1 Tax=Sporomusa acidovorans (strain ATCC 49682 / DSM 3132 / Mol) TaxID=1123286 RepID=A0ABZ3IZN9_SPOA4|nr:response regulator [Sporomusa acidovorans]OZC14152.1 HTH-type transcriptional regulator YesS [Sporomusa acidovorans DSM 3132]SDE69810.1 two-component system, response regulator YesN [Sporomusa acidovorans]